MSEEQPISSIEELLDRLCRVSDDGEQVSLGEMLDAAGRRSFGALLLVPGVVSMSPLSGIPGLPSAVAVIVLLIAAQLLVGRDCFWLPDWLLRRKASADRMRKAVRFLRPVARFADRITRPRLRTFVSGPAVYAIAACCVLVALTMPPLELIPFANTAAGAALTFFALALIAHDGLLASIGAALCAGGVTLLIVRLL